MITAATFDIETTSLNADFGIILCAVIKPNEPDSKPIVLRGDDLNPQWATARSCDRTIVRRLRDELCKYDILIAHNGLRFDVPFIRTRLAKWHLAPLPEIKLIDPVQLARNKLRMSRNSLASIAAYLGVNSKTPVAGDSWLRAALDGDRRSMNYIVEHCIEDVHTLERIVDSVKPYATAFNAWGSGR